MSQYQSRVAVLANHGTASELIVGKLDSASCGIIHACSRHVARLIHLAHSLCVITILSVDSLRLDRKDIP